MQEVREDGLLLYIISYLTFLYCFVLTFLGLDTIFSPSHNQVRLFLSEEDCPTADEQTGFC